MKISSPLKDNQRLQLLIWPAVFCRDKKLNLRHQASIPKLHYKEIVFMDEITIQFTQTIQIF